jgi:carbamoyltransferase
MDRRSRILGLHTAGHDAGACLFEDGQLRFSIEAERLTRVKHDHRAQPAIDHLLEQTQRSIEDIDWIVVGTTVNQELLGIPRLHEVMERIRSGVLHVETTCTLGGREKPCLVVAHEACHAALACHYSSDPDARTLVLTNEGRGTLARSALFLQHAGRLELLDREVLPWYACGFGWSGMGYALGLGKGPSVAGTVMGMAGYGQYSEAIHAAILEVDSEIMFLPRPEQERRMAEFLSAAWPERTFQTGAHLVATFQKVFEETVCAYVERRAQQADVRHVALSGGCALNVLCNSALRQRLNAQLAIPPAPNDAGIALGAAVYAQRYCLGTEPEPFSVFSNGASPSDGEIGAAFAGKGLAPRPFDPERLAAMLARGEVVALLEQKGEIGPRALGHRSLLGNPATPGMRKRMSEHIKGREWYRPLAPIMRAERFGELFPGELPSPYMLFSYAAGHAGIPEAVHVDGTARIQTVAPDALPRLHELLRVFEAQTGVPGLINTSLNQKGKAIAQTCDDAFSDFLNSEVSLFVMGDVMAENPFRREPAVRNTDASCVALPVS